MRFGDLREALASLPDDVRIVTDTNVLAAVAEILAPTSKLLVVPAGEQSKSMRVLEDVLSWLANTRASRKTTVVALGGGVIGDLVGFAAAVYMRGVAFVQIPTTLLSQVDSSVGGKVGIDLPEGKNLAGAFYPPVNVWIAPVALATLPDRQFRNGMAEVWKYGFIMDRGLLEILQQEPLSATHSKVETVVERCIRLKAQVVEADEFETLGLRAILNFGHTVGHVIEFVTGYGPVLHGEAISIGMVVEAELGEFLGVTPTGTAEVVRNVLKEQGLPIRHESLSEPDALIHAMYGDKKAANGRLAFSLLTGLGSCTLVEGVEEAAIREVLARS